MMARPDSVLVNDQADPGRSAPEPASWTNPTSKTLVLSTARRFRCLAITGARRPTN